MLEPGEEDRNLIGFHRRMLRNQLVVVVLRVEIEQMVLLTEHLAALIELTHADAYVVEFGIEGDIDDLLLGELDVVHLTEGGEEADDDGSTGGESADGQRALYDTTEAH